MCTQKDYRRQRVLNSQHDISMWCSDMTFCATVDGFFSRFYSRSRKKISFLLESRISRFATSEIYIFIHFDIC